MIPNSLRLGYSLNTWVFFILVVVILFKQTYFEEHLAQYYWFFQKYPIVLMVLPIFLVGDILLSAYTIWYIRKRTGDVL